jgi:hypothetical protein
MTKFEQMLLDKGYLKFVLNCKTMKYEEATGHTISTMVNLDHRYFHSSDTNVLQKIATGKSVMDEDFTWEDREGEICFGLHEAGRPPTLISPRPRIRIKRINEGREVVETEIRDDSMNIVLKEFQHEEIYKAMYDKSIFIELDLTLNHQHDSTH